ncbi:MAG TPA: aminomethyl transferase family protein [Sphingomonadaceae bacterium]|nr:aminomethyl transferase family protein [Sphingomonadaceae bacterium]
MTGTTGEGLEAGSGSLQDFIDSQPDLARYFYSCEGAPHASRRPGASPVPAEFSNWFEEQQAWRQSAVLFDQSHHMPELFLKGPDALRLLDHIGVNDLAHFAPGRAKQFVGCTRQGLMIGDCILHHHGDAGFELISGMPLLNWVHYHAETGGYDVEVRRDHDTPTNPAGRRTNFRFGMDGPRAGAIFGEAVDGSAPSIKFFNTARVRIAGRDVLALRHGMAGHQGVELSGAYEDGPAVRAALMEAGARHGLKQGGTRAYFSSVVESGWIAYPLPAIYTAPDLADYRRWLPANGWEARMQLAGSFFSPDLEAYYTNPFEMGYARIVSFDHDFVGRTALEEMARRPQRQKVTLAWNSEDVSAIFGSLFADELPYKTFELPTANYGFPHMDQVLDRGGRRVGIGRGASYSANERAMLSLAIVDPGVAEPGTELTLLWGEPDGGSAKPSVARHRQFPVRVTVGPAPYARAARAMKRAGI